MLMASRNVETEPNATSTIDEILTLDNKNVAGEAAEQSSDVIEKPKRYKNQALQGQYPAPSNSARGHDQKKDPPSDGKYVANASPTLGKNGSRDFSDPRALEYAMDSGRDYSPPNENPQELRVANGDQRNGDSIEPVVDEGENPQLQRLHGSTSRPTSRDATNVEGTLSTTVILDESLPVPVMLKSTTRKKTTVWFDWTLIFLWFLCCLILVAATVFMGRRLDWHIMSLITAVPLFDHPEGLFQFLATPLTLEQAKGIDFAVSAVVAPLLIAYANFVWYRMGRWLSNPEIEELKDPNADLTVETFDAGTYDLGKLLRILGRWTSRNILFVILLVSSALASTLLCNVLAYKAIPGSEAAPKDEYDMAYRMVYIPALLFFALCSATIASIAALFLVLNARRAIEEKKIELAATSMGVTMEDYGTMLAEQHMGTRRRFTLPTLTLPGFSLPAWPWWTYRPRPTTTGELEPLLPRTENIEDARVGGPSVFPKWRFSVPWKYPKYMARHPTAQDNAPEMVVNRDSELPVSTQRNLAEPTGPWKFRFWRSGLRDLSILESGPQMSEIPPEPTVRERIENESTPLLNVAKRANLFNPAPNFKIPKINWPGFPSLDWGQHPDPEYSHSHSYEPEAPQGVMSGIESSRNSEELMGGDRTATESRLQVRNPKKTTTVYNPARNFKLPEMKWLALPNLDWGQHSDPECSHVVHRHGATIPHPEAERYPDNAVEVVARNDSKIDPSTSWNLPHFQMPHLALASHKHKGNTEDLESQFASSQVSKGKDVERSSREVHTNTALPKQAAIWGLPYFQISDLRNRKIFENVSNVSDTEAHHDTSNITRRIEDQSREDTTERSKWKDTPVVDWAVQWIESNERAEKPKPSVANSARSGLGSGWVSQQGVAWTSDWASHSLVDFEPTLQEFDHSRELDENNDINLSPESKSTKPSQSRTLTTASKVSTNLETSHSRGWAFGGIDLPSLKGNWSHESHSTDKRPGETAKVNTTVHAIECSPDGQRSSRPSASPIVAEGSTTSYSWGHSHGGSTTISGVITSGKNGKERALHEKMSSSRNSLTMPADMSSAIQNEVVDESSHSATLINPGAGNNVNRWNRGWALRDSDGVPENGLRLTKTTASTGAVVSTSTTSTSQRNDRKHHHNHHNGHQHHHDHHHHHHHHDSQESKSKGATHVPIASGNLTQQSWSERTASDAPEKEKNRDGESSWVWSSLGRGSHAKKGGRPSWDFGEWGTEEQSS